MKHSKAMPDTSDEHFFLPDLCAIQSVFLLVMVAELLALVLVLDDSSLLGFSWERLAFVSLFVQWVTLTCAVVLCRMRPYLARVPLRRAVFTSYAVIPLVTLVYSLIGQWVVRTADTRVSLLSDTTLTHVVIALIVGGMVIRYFFLQSQLVARRQSELLHQLQALQSRIRPHFLFNSMNIIASLIESDPDTAEQVVEDLSELFRASLNDVGNQVFWSEEVALSQRYLHIEQLRLGDRLQVQWTDKSVPEAVKIPLLTLQPLLENAIVHGIQPLSEGGTIEIIAAYQHGIFELRITNPYAPHSAVGESARGNRMALENIQRRLKALYGDRAKLTAYTEDNRYITLLSYPCEIKATSADKGVAEQKPRKTT